MAQSSVQEHPKPQWRRNLVLWTAFILVFYLLHLGGVYLSSSFIHFTEAVLTLQNQPAASVSCRLVFVLARGYHFFNFSCSMLNHCFDRGTAF